MYYILIDGEQHGASMLWEEALIDAAQFDHELNSPEMNNGDVGTHVVQILSYQEMLNDSCPF